MKYVRVNTGCLLYLSIIVCHFTPLLRRGRRRWVVYYVNAIHEPKQNANRELSDKIMTLYETN